MKLVTRAFSEVMEVSIDSPMPSVIARGHADGNQGCWLLAAEERERERVGLPPAALLVSEPGDSPIFNTKETDACLRE